MLHLDDKPLSKHEIFEAEALIKKYEKAEKKSVESVAEAPLWLSVAAANFFSYQKIDLKIALESGACSRVRNFLRTAPLPYQMGEV